MKPIPGFKGYMITEDGQIFSKKTNKNLKLFYKSKIAPYYAANLYVGKSQDTKWKFKQVCVHEIMAHVFLGPKPSPKHVVAHLDGNPHNNVISNLKWCTQSENLSHRADHGTDKYLYNKDSNKRKLSDDDVRFIRKYKDRFSANKLAELFDMTPHPIQQIIKGLTYRDVIDG